MKLRITIRPFVNNAINLASVTMTDTKYWYLLLLVDQENRQSFSQVKTLSAQHNFFLLATKLFFYSCIQSWWQRGCRWFWRETVDIWAQQQNKYTLLQCSLRSTAEWSSWLECCEIRFSDLQSQGCIQTPNIFQCTHRTTNKWTTRRYVH